MRSYGRDFIDRLRQAGFSVKEYAVKDLASAEDAVKMGLTRAAGEVYYCRKR